MKFIWALPLVLLLVSCGGQEQDEERGDPATLGGKADVPSWIKHIPASWGCDSSVSGTFTGWDSAHMYSFPGKLGYTYDFHFKATYPWYKGAVLAVYDAVSGKRVAHERERWDNEVKLTYEAEADVKYLVAVYSVSWYAVGSYALSAKCTVTGCKVDAECAAGQFCKFKTGGCGGKLGAGTCTAKPPFCIEKYAPVCGCDGTTYGNDCKAASAGVSVDHTGKCVEQTKCAANGGYCEHFLTKCKAGYVSEAPMGCAGGKSAQCCVPEVALLTDKTSYAAAEKVAASLVNNLSESAFLPGCSAFSWQKQVSGSWVDQGPDKVCFWEGYAFELKAGATFAESLLPKGAGTFRLSASYGLGCTPGKPLSQASCKSTHKTVSEAFTVGAK
jgi:hypothetical protein